MPVALLTVPAGSVRQAADFALDVPLLLLLITVWWLVIDARPAFGLGSVYEVIIWERLAIELAVIGSVMLPAAWLPRRPASARPVSRR
jgi:hypothetical protein